MVGVCRTGVLRRAVLCGLFLQLAATAYGFKLSPMVQVLEPSGRGASAVFHVESDSDQQVTVEISMAKRVVDGDGKESTLPEEDNFSVYPSQILLDPKKHRRSGFAGWGMPGPSRSWPTASLLSSCPSA